MEGDTVNYLLSRQQVIEMGLVKRIEKVRAAFGEQGTIKTELVKINFQKNVEPYSVHTSRKSLYHYSQKSRKNWRRTE